MTKPRNDREWQIYFEGLDCGILLGMRRMMEMVLSFIDDEALKLEAEIDEREDRECNQIH